MPTLNCVLNTNTMVHPHPVHPLHPPKAVHLLSWIPLQLPAAAAVKAKGRELSHLTRENFPECVLGLVLMGAMSTMGTLSWLFDVFSLFFLSVRIVFFFFFFSPFPVLSTLSTLSTMSERIDRQLGGSNHWKTMMITFVAV